MCVFLYITMPDVCIIVYSAVHDVIESSHKYVEVQVWS